MKLVPTNLLNEIKANVTTLATCIEIRRTDGRTYRLTNHDQALSVEGNDYTHKIPFNLANITAGSNLSSNDTELTVALDGETFIKEEFDAGTFAGSGVTIMLVNYEDTSDGKIVLREGWFGPVDTNTYGVAKITLYGLLKVLDIEIGRVYQPSCDADLGDKRCKIAIKENQTYDPSAPYQTGEWVYKFDPNEATPITLVNPSFEQDAPNDGSAPIPGWTRSHDNLMTVSDNETITAVNGGYFLYGGPTEAGHAVERFVYQDVNLIDAGLNAAEIDDGQISLAVFGNLAHTVYLLDHIRLRVEIRNASGVVIDSFDDGYQVLDDYNVWRERSLIGPLLSGARSMRIFIYMKIYDGVFFNNAADNIRAYWWNHTEGTPYADLIHKVTRIVKYDDSLVRNAENGSFQAGTSFANSNVTDIPGWTRPSSADWWGVRAFAYLGINPPDDSRCLVGGDNGSGVESTYTLVQTRHLVDNYNVNADDIALGHIIAKLRFSLVYYDVDSSARVEMDFLDATDTLVTTSVLVDFETQASPVTQAKEFNFVVPALARKVRLTLKAKSGASVSAANVGFDNFRWYFANAIRAEKGDYIKSAGSDVTFTLSAGGYTMDGPLIWKAHTAHIQYDVVSAVSNRKTFNGTAIDGGEAAYSTAVIRWISGANAGQRNLIRLWDPDTKGIKLYFPTTAAIEVGDRFQYIRPCHKRFLEDCILTFDNVLNFRGFPHLPGKLS